MLESGGDTAGAGGARRRKAARFALRAGITGAILVALFRWLDTGAVLAAMKNTGLALWGVTVVAHVALHIGVAVKWRLLLIAAGANPPMLDTLRAHGAGVCANLYLPSIVGGEVVRVGMIASRTGHPTAVVSAGVVDRAMDLVALITLAAGGLLAVSKARSAVNLQVILLAAIGVIGSLAAFLVVVRLLHARGVPARLASVAAGLRTSFATIWRRRGLAMLALGASITIQALFVLQNVWLARAIGIDVPVPVWFAVWPIAKLASLSPFSLGGLGVREGVLAALLIPFGVPPALAVAESLVWQTVMYALGLVGGLTSLWLGAIGSTRRQPLAVADDIHWV